MTWNIDPNAVLISVIAIVPGLLAFNNSRKTRRSVQLAGSDVTVNNFNKLVQSLYAHITFLEGNEKKLRQKIDNMEKEEDKYRMEVELEKKRFMAQIDTLSNELARLQIQIGDAQMTIKKQQEELTTSNEVVKNLTAKLDEFKEIYEKLYAKKLYQAIKKGKFIDGSDLK